MRQPDYCLAIVISELLAIQFFGSGPMAERLELEEPEVVRAQRAHKMIDVGVEAVDGRRNQNDRSDANGDAEDGESRAQLVLAQSIERQLYRLTALTKCVHGGPCSYQLSVNQLSATGRFPSN